MKGYLNPGKSKDDLLMMWLQLIQQIFQLTDMHQKMVADRETTSLIPQVFDPNSRFIATLVTRQQMHVVEIHYSSKERTWDMECSCGMIDHSQRCWHMVAVAKRLDEGLRNPETVFSKMFRGESAAEDIRVDAILTLLNEARRTSKVDGSAYIDIEDFTSTPGSRIRWNLTIVGLQNSAYRIAIEPCIQAEGKNGKWLKARRMDGAQFLRSDRRDWSPLDHQLASAYTQNTVYSAPVLNLPRALQALAGSDAVLFDGAPVQLEVRPFEIELNAALHNGKPSFLLETTPNRHCEQIQESDPDAYIMVTSDSIVLINERHSRLIVYPCTHQQTKLAKYIIQSNPVFDESSLERLLPELRKVSEIIPVRLPESIAGREERAVWKTVVLLRLKKTGILETTLCLRDHELRLVRPGEGFARYSLEENGETIQYSRDFQGEIEQVQKAAKLLGLNLSEGDQKWTWFLNSGDAINELLTRSAELVQAEQLVVVWHKASVNQFDVIGSVTPGNVRVNVKRQRDWFGVTGTCTVGDEEVPLATLLNAVRGRSMTGLVEVTPGKWAALSDELRRMFLQLADASTEQRGKIQIDASAALTISDLEKFEIQVECDRAWEQCLARVRNAQDIPFDIPSNLICQLRDYQVDGFRWMCRLAEWGVGGILADDMGLGKTIQTIAVLLHRIESGPALVIAPTSLGFNWQNEIRRFAPSLTPLLLRDADRGELLESATAGQVVICSYGLVLREAERLRNVEWGTLVLDEAQNIKNSNSKTAHKVKTLKAGWKVALTGTPMENHLGELWSIFNAVAPGVLGHWEQFRKRFAAPIEKDKDRERQEALSRVISPFILRRNKKDVLKDLPDRAESNLLVDLSPEERQRYDTMRLAAVAELDDLGIDEEFSKDQRFKVLQILTRLRQLSCHISLVDPDWKGSSAKLELLMERLEQLKERGHRPLIFSQFTSHLALIREACEKAGISYQYLDGQTTPQTRQDRVNAFQAGEGDVFLISLKAGGTGLNLTAADYVIHMDPWWNPAVEDQATDRAHRIGQTKNVMVYRIIARGTIEEKILSLHDEKRDLVEGVLSGAESAGRMSTEELADLIRDTADDVKVGKRSK
ncbi:MAG: DEAD/DEAH box helicase [Planctomyces sp.]|nr:DEAD/DEAH box helicase [Planctomyces sp.]